jgi:hypothetical protein
VDNPSLPIVAGKPPGDEAVIPPSSPEVVRGVFHVVDSAEAWGHVCRASAMLREVDLMPGVAVAAHKQSTFGRVVHAKLRKVASDSVVRRDWANA